MGKVYQHANNFVKVVEELNMPAARKAALLAVCEKRRRMLLNLLHGAAFCLDPEYWDKDLQEEDAELEDPDDPDSGKTVGVPASKLKLSFSAVTDIALHGMPFLRMYQQCSFPMQNPTGFSAGSRSAQCFDCRCASAAPGPLLRCGGTLVC